MIVISQLDFSSAVSCFPDKRYILVLSNDAATLSQSVSCSFGAPPPQGALPAGRLWLRP